jgi:hypothetical protein
MKHNLRTSTVLSRHIGVPLTGGRASADLVPGYPPAQQDLAA